MARGREGGRGRRNRRVGGGGDRRGQSCKNRRIAGAEMEKAGMGLRVSVGLCARTAKLVSPSPCTFMSPHVPFMSSCVPGHKVTRIARSPL